MNACAQCNVGRIGPSEAKPEVAETIAKQLDEYVAAREGEETFLYTVRRSGVEPLRKRVYAKSH